MVEAERERTKGGRKVKDRGRVTGGEVDWEGKNQRREEGGEREE